MTYYELEYFIELWAKEKQIIGKALPSTQTLKTASELGELCDAIIKNDRDGQIDAIGDVMVCLIILCRMLELDLVLCLESAYNVIKNRTGTSLPNGTFVKDK